MKIYNYRNSNLIASISWGLCFAGFLTYVIWRFHGNDFGSGAIDTAFILACLVHPIYGLMRFVNERICVDQDSIRWFSWAGHQRARIALSAIKPGSLRWSRSSDGVTCQLRCEGQQIDFSGKFSDAGRLIQTLIIAEYGRFTGEQPSQIPDEKSFRTPARVWIFNMALLPIAAAVLLAIGLRWERGNLQAVFLFIMYPVPLGVYQTIRQRNEVVTIANGRLIWKDWLGRKRIDVPFSEIIPG